MGFEGREGFGGSHVRNEAHVDFGDGAAGENGLAAGAGVAADKAFDVDRRARGKQLERFLKTYIVNPMLDAEKFFGFGFAEATRGFGDHFLFGIGERAGLGGEAFDGRVVAVGGNERGESFDEMPRGAVEARLVAGVHVFARAAAPLFAAGDELELDNTFGAEKLRDFAVEALRRKGHEDAVALFKGGENIGAMDDLREMRGADFFFAFGDEYEIYRELAACAANGVKGGEESGFWTFLINGAAADDDLAESRLVDQRGVPRRRGPLGGIDLLDVVHEVEADGFGGAGVERGEDAGLAVGGDHGDLSEAGVAQHLHGELAAFVHTAVFGGDGGLANPGLQTLEGFVVALIDFGENGIEVGGGARPARKSERGSACDGSLKESSTVGHIHLPSG